ncbi:MAG: hypothetical protein EXX96DRAFT_580241 [Benjaminiella poitrasii]|nr:MAG: hypothetical protein EXX96DRAFT_580241 [Benjaminiella poitrasii]
MRVSSFGIIAKPVFPFLLSTSLQTCLEYKGIFPTTIAISDGIKPTIRTKIYNAFVTSSFRLDALDEPEIRPVTSLFLLDSITKSKNAFIFIENTSWTGAVNLFKRNDDVYSTT